MYALKLDFFATRELLVPPSQEIKTGNFNSQAITFQ